MSTLRYAYLHGFASSSRSRKGLLLAERFAARGLRLELPDLNRPSFDRLTLSGALQALDALHAQAPGARWRLIGSSMGGYLALRWAELRPEAVERVVALCPGLDMPSRWAQLLGAEAVDVWQRTGAHTFPDATGVPTAVAFDLLDDARRNHPPVPHPSQPVLLIHGCEDATVPIDLSRAYAAQHPNARLVELTDDHQLLASVERIAALVFDFFHLNPSGERPPMDDATRTELEAAAFRRLLDHLREHTEVQNIDLMNLAGFCRNCLAKWYLAAAEERGLDLSSDQAREIVYGMPYAEWKAKHQR